MSDRTQPTAKMPSLLPGRLRIAGILRETCSPSRVVLYFNRRPTDTELRRLENYLVGLETDQ